MRTWHPVGMTSSVPFPRVPSRCSVHPATRFFVETGALLGDPLGGLDEAVAGDVYLFRHDTPQDLIVDHDGHEARIAEGSMVGTPGTKMTPIARHQVMNESGRLVEILVLEHAGERLLLPLGPLADGDEYTLIASEAVADGMTHVARVSFTAGTRITMAGGRQRAAEALNPGDRVLTRDHGPQPIKWMARQTVWSEGDTAPVVISVGALNNANELVLSPDHRLFLYRRQDGLGTGKAETLVRARHLVDGEGIRRGAPGHLDYVHILFDRHEIIYAEGIPAESLLVRPTVLAGLDDDLAAELQARIAGNPQVPHHGVEPTAAMLAAHGEGLRKRGAVRS